MSCARGGGYGRGLLAFRAKMSETGTVKGSEFIRKVQGLAKARSLGSRVAEKRGKGSHVTLYFGNRITIVRNPKDELKT